MLDQEFWDAYTDRQSDADTEPALRAILGPYLGKIKTALEVGCNRGDNLVALGKLGILAWGVEPNPRARTMAINRNLFAWPGDAKQTNMGGTFFDLALTCGVLIHVPAVDYEASLAEIMRVARCYILLIEYAADNVTPVTYRGIPGGIIKRPYGNAYPNLIAQGEADPPFEGCNWWLFDAR